MQPKKVPINFLHLKIIKINQLQTSNFLDKKKSFYLIESIIFKYNGKKKELLQKRLLLKLLNSYDNLNIIMILSRSNN
ncbi:unnamed protein product [Commensalibacter communis]|uniref:Uncharacterized protein n=1 Tax=Commensalibacter communis TaxID=2972786 RepID=A0A9W4TTJ2_9PROT|nr:unnamed protein product [Commensalibacter communis]CAI3961358.1 unnamed protein product [Commensalibacter communis]CAI3961460.1 unnamed protein product [Commensalibacter communis]CAI3961763.1 unnamed protein product [Commensalibacter communis]